MTLNSKYADRNTHLLPSKDPIFVSYAHADSDIVTDLVSRLEKAGCSVWWDQKLHSGEFFALIIEDRISTASAILVVWSVSARRSVWVHGEASAGLETGRLVQVRLDSIRPPVPFNAIHVIDLSGWPRNGDERIGAILDAVRRPSCAQLREAAQVAPHPAISLSGWAIALLSACAPIVAVAALLGVQTETLDANIFSVLAVTSFAASAAALVAAVRTWAWLDTKEPTRPLTTKVTR